jgi:hypothetical protein
MHIEKIRLLVEKQMNNAEDDDIKIRKTCEKIPELWKKTYAHLGKIKAAETTEKKTNYFVRARSVISEIKDCVERTGLSFSEDGESPLKERLFGCCACNDPVHPTFDATNVGKHVDVDFDRFFYIDKSDFALHPDADFLRLTPEQPVGLLGLFPVKFVKELENVLIVRKTSTKPKKFIQWVSYPITVQLNMYSPLFDPDGKVNKKSLHVAKGYCDKRVKGAKVNEKFQFVRMGYFSVDKRSKKKKLVFNLTVALKGVS